MWCGDGVSDCLGTVRRTLAGSEISIDTHMQGGGIQKMMLLRGLVGCVCLVRWRLHICFRVVSQVGRPLCPIIPSDHQTFGCSRCWTESDDSLYIVSRNFEFAHTSASMCPSSPTKTCHKIPNIEAMLGHTTDKCTTDNVFHLWKTGWSAFFQFPQVDAPSQRCAEAHRRRNLAPSGGDRCAGDTSCHSVVRNNDTQS